MEANVSKMPSITEAMKLNMNELKKFSLESAVSTKSQLIVGGNQLKGQKSYVGIKIKMLGLD